MPAAKNKRLGLKKGEINWEEFRREDELEKARRRAEAERVASELWHKGRASLQYTPDYLQKVYPKPQPMLLRVRLAGNGLIARLAFSKSMKNIDLLSVKPSSRVLVYYPRQAQAGAYSASYGNEMPFTPGMTFPGCAGALHYHEGKNTAVVKDLHGGFQQQNLEEGMLENGEWALHLLDEFFREMKERKVKEVAFSQQVTKVDRLYEKPVWTKSGVIRFAKGRVVRDGFARNRLNKFMKVALLHGFEINQKTIRLGDHKTIELVAHR